MTGREGWDVGKGISEDWLTCKAEEEYHNMVQQGEWKKVDPKDQKFSSLATRIKSLETGKGGGTGSGGPPKNNYHGGGGRSFPELWMTRKKGDVILPGVT